MHESIGREALALWYDRSNLFQEFTASDPIDLRVRCGLALTQAGPVSFILWWMPPVSGDGTPTVVVEQLLDPLHQGTCEILAKLRSQNYLHLALVGAKGHICGLHEFKNEFAFTDFYAYAQAALETKYPVPCNFEEAILHYNSEFTVKGLLYDQYPRRVFVVGDCPS